ncbi:MAG: putative amino acid racemase [Candidatus Aldehydirespiratoraceae bacterium]|jgi:predicted amino acid racemase
MMNGLRIDVDLEKISDNARSLVDRAAQRGISITGVTKALLGEPRLARVLVAAGVVALGDSRIENIERMRHAHVNTRMMLMRSPMMSQVNRVVRSNTISVNSNIDVLTELATAARVCGRVHPVMIMAELGDLRVGAMANDLHAIVRHILRCPSLRLEGIGTNFACRSGIEPIDEIMGELSGLVEKIESAFGIHIDTVSGGNSANIGWLASTENVGRINNLRLGESILLGRGPLCRQPIEGLHTNAITLVGEVIESHRKPTRPRGRANHNVFGEVVNATDDRGEIWQTTIAAGTQDTDPDDIRPPVGITVLAASTDHLILATPARMKPGSSIRFELGYSALLRSMTSPFVAKELTGVNGPLPAVAVTSRRQSDVARLRPERRPTLTIMPRI